MAKEKVGFDFRLKETDETKKYFLQEINHNYLISEKHNKCVELYITLSILFLFLQSVIGFQFLNLLH